MPCAYPMSEQATVRCARRARAACGQPTRAALMPVPGRSGLDPRCATMRGPRRRRGTSAKVIVILDDFVRPGAFAGTSWTARGPLPSLPSLHLLVALLRPCSSDVVPRLHPTSPAAALIMMTRYRPAQGDSCCVLISRSRVLLS